MMNPRERYIAAVTFQKPDRVPFEPGGGRESTLAAWHRQGLPAEVTDYHAYVRELLGLPPEEKPAQPTDPGVNFRMIPQFEEKVLEHRPSTDAQAGVPGVLVVQDWKGNVCAISDEYDERYLRDPIDFVTRSWLRCPVGSRADWPDMARRYRAADPARLPADFPARAARLKNRNHVSGLCINGPFWQLREWLGFEGLCVLLLDDPDFALEMIDFWKAFVSALLGRVLEQYTPDSIMICEDMAYKEKPMIGPEMARRFLLPSWRAWGEQARAAGVPIYEVDSDGFVGSLIPLWIEAGFNLNSPQEIAAGNDPAAYRNQFGTRMAYRGGVDKRKIAAGGVALRDELKRLQPAIDAGGFIPGCDHGVPADVSWPNFVEYCRLLAAATGWL
jgi:uroporphyrinogen decarboxylase